MLGMIQLLLNNDDFKTKVNHCIKKLDAHTKILNQGEKHIQFYFIMKGKVKIVVRGEVENHKKISPGIVELKENDIFGEFSLFDTDTPANADVITVTEVELLEINNESFRKYLEENTKIGYKFLLYIFDILVKRLRHADSTILNIYAWGLKAHNIDKHL